MRSAAYADLSSATEPRQRPFQPEIQGLRAISILAVVCAHAGLPGLRGGFTGVDVFFVISGFLITRLLLGEVARTGRIDLLAFWARRARRLLPNAFATLTGTVLLTLLLFPGYPLDSLAGEVRSAALEIVNFHFARKAVDYFRADGPVSPILHFWSLSVEEQFYLIWPLLLFGVSRAFGNSHRRAGIVLGLIWCASLTASLVITDAEQPVAYFSTLTRCWQLATGGLLAAGWASIERLSRAVRLAMAWLGLAAVLAGFMLLDGVHYPGYAALLPTLGAAALLAGFEAANPQGLFRLGLSASVMQWIGARSYSWYLWHWPLLILPRLVYPEVPFIEAIAVPVSAGVASAAYAFIELPIHRGRLLASEKPFHTLIGAAVGLALVICIGYLAMPVLLVIDNNLALRLEQIQLAAQDMSRARREGCILKVNEVEQPDCLYGDVTGQRRAVIFGDSHADNWFAAFDTAAQQTGWQLRSWTKGGCPTADVPIIRGRNSYLACETWRDSVMLKLTGPNRPDLVILGNRMGYASQVYNYATGNRLPKQEGEEAWREGFRKVIRRLLAAGVKVLILRDIPWADKSFKLCLQTGLSCKTPRSRALALSALDADVAHEFGYAVSFADFTDAFCDEAACDVNRNGTIIYWDDDHITASFAATFAPQMARLLDGISFGSAVPLPLAGSARKEAGSLNLDPTSSLGAKTLVSP